MGLFPRRRAISAAGGAEAGTRAPSRSAGRVEACPGWRAAGTLRISPPRPGCRHGFGRGSPGQKRLRVDREPRPRSTFARRTRSRPTALRPGAFPSSSSTAGSRAWRRAARGPREASSRWPGPTPRTPGKHATPYTGGRPWRRSARKRDLQYARTASGSTARASMDAARSPGSAPRRSCPDGGHDASANPGRTGGGGRPRLRRRCAPSPKVGRATRIGESHPEDGRPLEPCWAVARTSASTAERTPLGSCPHTAATSASSSSDGDRSPGLP